jgi:hypothetical protein
LSTTSLSASTDRRLKKKITIANQHNATNLVHSHIPSADIRKARSA